ncbi:putative phage tail fiber assembly protein [Yersinia mollaretii]|uniref:tail fiber assembly protein n=1 Tax=Yersinia mollaretii TaxID=33060 RepID=UPI0005E551ED|nr:tail fiber assembly protein [Yersinia mollaretii]CNK70442.1 putative phage tail fiber assembly protein [Yersinia mollaretii]
MVIYARPGESTENISYIEPFELPEEFIIMAGSRPTPTHYADDNGEWLAGPAPQVVQQMIIEAREKQTALLSHASDIISTLIDEIEGLEDNDDVVPDKLRTDLKAWKQYRVKVKNVDVSLVPDIEWPTAPE